MLVSGRRSLKPKDLPCFEKQLPPCEPLNQEHIDELINNLLTFCGEGGNNLSEFLSPEIFMNICHRAIDLFRRSGTLLYVHDPEGLAVIGDLHGDFHNFMKVIENTGWPNQHTLLFLGDYVDRGPETVELVLFILLLKIRYPQRVFMLRGNHETYECGIRYELVNKIEQMYGPIGTYLFKTLEFTFDYLPLAAVVSGMIFYP